MKRRRRFPFDNGFRHGGDFGQGPRFERPYDESRVSRADASYQGYGAYATLDGSRVDEGEYAELDYTGVELERDLERGHAGRGPRGYRRSDASIRDDLHVALTVHPEIDASDVEVAVAGGAVLLLGAVPDRTTKRFIEDIAYQIAGVRDVTNLLHIGAPSSLSEPTPELTPGAEEEDAVLEAQATPPVSTLKDDHPSRRDAYTTEHLHDHDARDQVVRAQERADLHSHDYTGPRDTSANERLEAPDAPLITPRVSRRRR